jgi:peptidoglycan-N-acetylglucosamine deacetylase
MTRPMRSLCILLTACLLLQCNEDRELMRKTSYAGVALSFDDYFVDNWYQYKPLLDSFNVRLTLYICCYSGLTDSEKQKLKELQAEGHEIAFHSCKHLNALQALQSMNIGDYMQQEILPGLDSMRKDGFRIENFAYPYGAFTAQTDSALLHHFRNIRKLEVRGWEIASLYDNSRSFYGKGSDRRFFYPANIDQSSGIGPQEVCKALERAVKDKRVLMLYGHYISPQKGTFYTDPSLLRFILQQARLRKMRFYTTSELCRF